MKKLALFVTLTLVFLSPAIADRAVDETRTASADGDVSVELIAGSVRIIGWDRNEVRVSGTIGDDVEELEVSTSSRGVSIEVVLPDDDERDGRRLRDVGADLEIHVPSGSSVETETVSADVSVEGVSGAVEMESVSGDVTIEGAMREAEAATVSGDIRVTSDAPLREGEFASVSGDIYFRAELESGGDFSFEAVSGDIELRLPANTSADFSVDTFSGRIDNEFGPQAQKDSRYLPSKSLDFTIGSGSADVEVESFSGRVSLKID